MPAEAPPVSAIPVSAPLPSPGSADAGQSQSPSAGADFDSYFTNEPPAPTPGPGKPANKSGDPIGKPATPPVKEVPIRPEAAGSGKKNEQPTEKPAEQAKPDNGSPVKGDKNLPGDNAKPEAGKADKKPRETPWQIIHRYEKELGDLRKEKETWTKQTNGDHPELKSAKEQLTALQKRAEDLETRLKFADYSQSDEFKEKYEAPFLDAYMAGRSRAAGLMVNVEGQNPRKGTAEDFDTIMSIPNDDQAAEAAIEMFGSKAPLVMFHREKVMELNGVKNKALEDYRTKGSETSKKAKEATEKQMVQIAGEIENLWKNHVEAPREKYTQYSKPVEGDDEGNKLLERGYTQSHEAFSNLNPFDPKLDAKQRERIVRLHGMVLNKSAWFDRVALRATRAEARAKELEAKLAEFEASEPGADNGKGRGKAPVTDNWEAQMEKYAK